MLILFQCDESRWQCVGRLDVRDLESIRRWRHENPPNIEGEYQNSCGSPVAIRFDAKHLAPRLGSTLENFESGLR